MCVVKAIVEGSSDEAETHGRGHVLVGVDVCPRRSEEAVEVVPGPSVIPFVALVVEQRNLDNDAGVRMRIAAARELSLSSSVLSRCRTQPVTL